MLWKKESIQPDAFYIDIFTPNIEHWETILNSELQKIDQKPHPEKSDTISLAKRNKGNEKFRDSSPLEAMEFYNDSLRFAKPGSEHISLAFANRSACFLQLKMYDECLADIQWAKKAGYPEHLRPKLDEREIRCLKEMQDDPQYPREKLSIEPNEKIPYLSNMAMVQRNGEAMDYSVVAKTDINVGQPVAIEDVYQAYVLHSFGLYCNICAKQFCTLVPCDKCAVAMFCPECQGHFLHEYECGLSICGESEFNSTVMSSVRDILLVLLMFTTAGELMTFVERMLKKPNELPISLLDDRSKYQAYFNSPIKKNIEPPYEKFVKNIYFVYNTLLRIPKVNQMFNVTKHRRFLMHLIGHHVTIPDYIIDIYFLPPNPLGPPMRINSVMNGYFKHSCYPNVEFVINGGKCNWYSVKPIKKGEKLFFTHFHSGSIKERKKFLNEFKIKCECSRCQGKTAAPAQREQLVSDPAFRYINANIKNHQSFIFDCSQIKTLMEASTSILQKYGQMDWCDEIAFVANVFDLFYKVRSVGGGTDWNHPLARKLLSTAKAKCINSTE